MITHTTDLERAQAAEIERLRAALNKIASWHEGPVVTGAFDEPHSAMTARAALGAQPAQPAQRLTDEQITQALRRAYYLGQTYWQQADSEFTSEHRKADATSAKFNALIAETIAAAQKEQP